MTTGIISGGVSLVRLQKMQQETKLQMKKYVLMLGSVMKDTGHRLLTVSKTILTMLF